MSAFRSSSGGVRDEEVSIMADFQHVRLIEALLFASAEPLDDRALADRLPDGTDLGDVLTALQAELCGARRPIWFGVTVSGPFARRPIWPRRSPSIAKVDRKLSRAAIETLAIIAYHQPVTRAEIEEMRGVALSKGTLDVLFEAGWVRPRGRRKRRGVPCYGRRPLAFSIISGWPAVDDLPGDGRIEGGRAARCPPGLSSYANRADEEGEPVDVEEDLDEEALERRALKLCAWSATASVGRRFGLFHQVGLTNVPRGYSHKGETYRQMGLVALVLLSARRLAEESSHLKKRVSRFPRGVRTADRPLPRRASFAMIRRSAELPACVEALGKWVLSAFGIGLSSLPSSCCCSVPAGCPILWETLPRA